MCIIIGLGIEMINIAVIIHSKVVRDTIQYLFSDKETLHAFSFPATPGNTRNGADCSILETSWSMSQFHTVENRKISRRNYHVKHIHAVCNSMRQKGETV